eukprot:307335-Pelagomonas_calceolata.AAC.2
MLWAVLAQRLCERSKQMLLPAQLRSALLLTAVCMCFKYLKDKEASNASRTSRTCSSTVLLMGEGNLPALFRPGPSRRGICLMTESLARKAWYDWAAGVHGAGAGSTGACDM